MLSCTSLFQNAGVEAIITATVDQWPELRKVKVFVTLFWCVIFFMLGLTMCTRVSQLNTLSAYSYITVEMLVQYFYNCESEYGPKSDKRNGDGCGDFATERPTQFLRALGHVADQTNGVVGDGSD